MKIIKTNMSRNPWRLVNARGQEITMPVVFDHPDIGKTVVRESVSGATRKECETNAMALLELLAEEHLRGAQPRIWRPVETAPRDNARPLYLAQFNAKGELLGLDYDGIWEYWQESAELPETNGYRWMSDGGLEEPTHWAYQDEGPPPCIPVK